ncbi:hypothetical protein LF41_1748 [Lysobacter dokdonensis DS-58]|uniref:Uncharacterized protein n=1 Tax=Lysobacter dokdonensis DS-58 TaxID=1300345 RepID=A0A0A2WXY3_9GAMM|nr:hypothetical protein LF41_1748 [Lysobacter dokdonensis DS-58]
MPSKTRTKGTTQQIEAPMAARLAPRIPATGDLVGLLDIGAY